MDKNVQKSMTGARVFIILVDIFLAIWVWLVLLGITLISIGVTCGSGVLFFMGLGAIASLGAFKLAGVFGCIALLFLTVMLLMIAIVIVELFFKATAGYLSCHHSMWCNGFTERK